MRHSLPDPPDDAQPPEQAWYAIAIRWGGSPQYELIVTRDAKLTIRRTVDYLGRMADATGSGWLRQNPPPDAARADMAEVDDWFEQFQAHSSRPILEWHRIPAPDEGSKGEDDGSDLPGVVELPDERPHDPRD
ncbi:hypothetical protein [Kribbella swartbergensis]